MKPEAIPYDQLDIPVDTMAKCKPGLLAVLRYRGMQWIVKIESIEGNEVWIKYLDNKTRKWVSFYKIGL